MPVNPLSLSGRGDSKVHAGLDERSTTSVCILAIFQAWPHGVGGRVFVDLL